MRLGMIGINHKLADLKLREQLAKACQRRFGASCSVHRDHHFILLSTCNRTEVYFSSKDLSVTHTYLLSILRNEVEEEFDHKLYSFFGTDCFSHLARVTVGLDSAVIAETEIQGQVKSAYEVALEYHHLPKELHFLFQKSIHVAKKIRSELNLGRGMPKLEQAILETGKHFFSSLENTRILFVGASEINEKILSFLKAKNLSDITLCNRSHENAESISEIESIKLLDWAYLSKWHEYDWIIFGTKSPEYLVRLSDLPNDLIGSKLIMDLCVPRNVEPKIGQNSNVTLLNIDQLNQMLVVRNQYANQILEEAEAMIYNSAYQHINSYLEKEQRNKITPLVVVAG
ncbi:MAG: glutamyl-tRNA reductase [Parachlamydiaceae bacterium]|nr:glutamyl-tRNA reductase [Parachlamydiaceae bacterium]